MQRFTVQIAETRNYEIAVEASDETDAETRALLIFRIAPTIEDYELSDTAVDVVAVTPRLRT